MNLTKLKTRLDRLVEHPSDRELLYRIADDVGHELTRSRPAVLRQFRAEADTACRRLAESCPRGEGTEFARGVLTALVAVARLVDLEQQHQQQQEEIQALVRRPLFRRVLESLRGTSRTRTGVAQILRRDQTQVSHVLQELEAAGLVRAADRGRLGGRGEQFYRLSVTGILQLDRVSSAGPSEPRPLLRRGGGGSPGRLPDPMAWSRHEFLRQRRAIPTVTGLQWRYYFSRGWSHQKPVSVDMGAWGPVPVDPQVVTAGKR